MTTKNEIPTLEELLGAEKVETLKAEIAKVTAETYQPLLDTLGKNLTFDHTKAEVTATVELALTEEDGKPVVSNHVVLGVTFTPATTHDLFEQVNRSILTNLFASAIQK